MGGVEKEMRKTPNAQRLTSNAQFRQRALALAVERWTLGVGRWAFSLMTMRIVRLVLVLTVGATFIYAGILKVVDPVQFARDIDNYKMLPWPATVAFALYLPWLEILCGLALIIRRLHRGAVLLLIGLTIVFIVASIIAKARGLDISCGCFGHASKGWSFGWHLLLDLGILAALVVLVFDFAARRQTPTTELRTSNPEVRPSSL